MDKLKLAHEFMLAMIKAGCSDGPDLLERAWQYADAMQAEADKRKPSGLPEALKEEWQPDWSQAPEWANWWVIDKDGESAWCEEKPIISDSDFWYGKEGKAPSFNYQGNWQESLRKRPQ